MCDICIKATDRLQKAVDEIENEFPGTTVGDTSVSRSHHVTVALTVLAEKYMAKEMLDQLMGGRNSAGLFGMKELSD